MGRVAEPWDSPNRMQIPTTIVPRHPVPRQMLEQVLTSVYGEALDNQGVVATITIPDGEKRSERTLNARLGIIGGLSILGTTGIV